MKKILLIIGLAFSMNAFSYEQSLPTPPLKLMPEILENKDMLGLSDVQVMQLTKMAKTNHEDRDIMKSVFNDLQGLLAETILMKGDNRKEISSITKDIKDLMADYMQLTSYCVENVKIILSDEQYDEIIDIYSFKN